MKIIYSIILSLIFISSALSAETNKYDFTQGKKIDAQAGAWQLTQYEDCFAFFFEDGTVLHVNHGRCNVGKWKFVNKEKTKIKFSYYPAKREKDIFTAVIKNSRLFVDHGDYDSIMHRLDCGACK
jgi:hypothetical protein